MKRLVVGFVTATVAFLIGVTAHTVFIGKTDVSLFTDKISIEAVAPATPAIKIPSLLVESNAEFVFDRSLSKFDPRGSYFIIGRNPKEFRDFEAIEIETYEINGKAVGNIMLRTYSGASWNDEYIIKGNITGKRLTFAATPIFEEDFEYLFDGNFLKSGDVCDADRNQAVLKGRLTKLKDGIKIADREIKFRAECLGC